MKATTEQLVSALRVLSVEIQSEDGVANAVVAEAADRITLLAQMAARHLQETQEDTTQMHEASEAMAAASAKIQELRKHIKRLEEAGVWQPIETAPTDMTWVIGYDAKDGEVGTIIFDLTGDVDDEDVHYEWTDGMRTWHPTHWMPLPEPPKAKEATPSASRIVASVEEVIGGMGEDYAVVVLRSGHTLEVSGEGVVAWPSRAAQRRGDNSEVVGGISFGRKKEAKP